MKTLREGGEGVLLELGSMGVEFGKVQGELQKYCRGVERI